MSKTDDIEKLFSKASQIGFVPSRNINKEPSVISIGFDDHRAGHNAYKDLLAWANNDELALVVYKKEKAIDVSFIHGRIQEIVNIKNLKFDTTSLSEFAEQVPQKEKLILVAGINPVKNNNLITTEKEFRPLGIAQYRISQ